MALIGINFKRGVSVRFDRIKFKIISFVVCCFLSYIPCPISPALEYLSRAANLVKIAAFYALFEQLLSDTQQSAAGTVMFLQYMTVMTQNERCCYITFLASLFYNFTTMWYMYLNLIVELIIDFILQDCKSSVVAENTSNRWMNLVGVRQFCTHKALLENN